MIIDPLGRSGAGLGAAARPRPLRCFTRFDCLSIQLAQDLPPCRVGTNIGAVTKLVNTSNQPPRHDAAHLWAGYLGADRRREPAAIDHLEWAAEEAGDR